MPGFRRWLRGSDSNRRPSGYEPDELPLLHPAKSVYLATGTGPVLGGNPHLYGWAWLCAVPGTLADAARDDEWAGWDAGGLTRYSFSSGRE